MNELVTIVSEKTGLSPEQSQAAVDAVLAFLKERLPAPLVEGFESLLGPGAGEGGGIVGTLEHELEGKAMSALGGLFGSKG